jgi:hypothetical protein
LKLVTRSWWRWLNETQLAPGSGPERKPTSAHPSTPWQVLEEEQSFSGRRGLRTLRIVGLVIVIVAVLSAVATHVDNPIAQVIMTVATVSAFPLALVLDRRRGRHDAGAYVLICCAAVIILVTGVSSLLLTETFDNCGTIAMLWPLGYLALGWRWPRITLWILLVQAAIAIAVSIVFALLGLVYALEDPIPAWARLAFLALDAAVLGIAIAGLRATRGAPRSDRAIQRVRRT